MRLTRYAVVIATGVLLLLSIGRGETQERLRFSDMAGTDTLVYPDGPSITVLNPKAVAAEIWVVRLLDGAVVRRYPPPDRKGATWKESVRVDASGKDDLGARVKGQKAPLAYALFLLGPDREVQDILRFDVRVSAGRETPTLPLTGQWPRAGKEYAYMSSGTLQAIKTHEIVVRMPDGDVTFKTGPAHVTKVFGAGGKFGPRTWKASDFWESSAQGIVATYDPTVFGAGGAFGAWTWEEAKGELQPGDQVSIIYASSDPKREVDKFALQLVVANSSSVPPSAPTVDPFAKLRFQVGTVVSAKEAATPPSDMIVETKNGSGRWRIRETTKIMRGAVEGRRSDLSSNALVAVGAREFQKGEVIAAHVLLLIDLTDGAKP